MVSSTTYQHPTYPSLRLTLVLPAEGDGKRDDYKTWVDEYMKVDHLLKCLDFKEVINNGNGY